MSLATLLGGLTPQRFLRDYWQKKPLLLRQAVPGFAGLLSRNELLDLACGEDAEARLVWHDSSGWRLRHGPFAQKDFRRRGAWTVLVQGLNLLRDDAEELLHRFDFVPWARLDDLMVSYATHGGGVGPHFDSYDVFLLQGMGRRRWEISAQRELDIIEGAPLRILKHFSVDHEWVLEPGDMLYLPPSYAHNGIADGECMTYSVGFRAPPAQELATQFLVYLQDRVQLDGRYADPNLKQPRHCGEIGSDMLDQVATMIDKLSWKREGIRQFLGCYLTEPKAQVFFDPPDPPLSRARFLQRSRRSGVKLDRKSQLLFSDRHFFLNGEVEVVPRGDRPAFRELADRRRLDRIAELSEEGLDLIYAWYCDGFLLAAGQT